MGPKTEKHDFEFKLKHVRRFLEEAGGRLTDLRGGPVDIDHPRVVASNGLIHEPMLAVLKEIRG